MRKSYKANSGFGAASLKPTTSIQIAIDNLVCVACEKALPSTFCCASTPKRKGIVAFCCQDHLSDAMNILSKATGGEAPPVPNDLKLPDDKNN